MVRQHLNENGSCNHNYSLLRLKQIYSFFVILILCVFTTQALAALTATVDRVSISENDILTLTIRSTKDQIGNEVDLSELRKDFSIINSRLNNQLSFINGKRTANYDLILTIAPNRSGSLTIPAFNFKGEVSQAIQITASNKPVSASGTLSEVFLDNNVNKQEVYVQEQILYTLKIYHSVGLSDANLSPLAIKNAVVKQLGDQTQYETVLKGIRYSVIEINYAVFPDASGRLEIPLQTLTARASARRNDFFRPSSKFMRIQSPTQIISVLPKSASFPANAPWLPTPKLEISDSWANNPPSLKVGESTTRSIAIRALGLSNAQLPELKMPIIANTKSYPDQAQSDDNISSTGIVGQKIQATALLPQLKGPLQIPEKVIYWWNTNTDQLETSIIPAINTQVAAAANTSSAPATLTPNIVTSDIGFDAGKSTGSNNSILWPSLAGVFALLWFATLYLWGQSNQRGVNLTNTPSLPTVDRSNLKQTFRTLQDACHANDPRATRTALIHWFQLHYNTNKISNLENIQALNAHPSMSNILAELESCIYSKAPETFTWQGQPLLEIINTIKKSKRLKKTQQHALPPLYPL